MKKILFLSFLFSVSILHGQNDFIVLFNQEDTIKNCREITLITEGWQKGMMHYKQDAYNKKGKKKPDYLKVIDYLNVKSYSVNGKIIIPSVRSHSQEQDSIVQAGDLKEIKIQDEFIYIRNCLNKCHKQYSTGISLFIGGLLVSSSGLLFYDVQPNDIPILTITANILGGGLMLVGGIIQIDSHKWIKRASIGVGGEGFVIKYTL